MGTPTNFSASAASDSGLVVKDCDRISASSQSLDLDKDYFPSFPDGNIDPSEKVMSQNEALSLDEMKDSRRTSEIDNEALAADDYFKAELEKIKYMIPEEADAAENEAHGKWSVAVWAACDATCEAEKALTYLGAIQESDVQHPRNELEKMWSRLTPEEASTEVSKIFDAAKRKLCAAEHTVRKSARFIKAIGKAREKRPMTDCEDQGGSCSY